jgi:type I restriction enzyme S subunit
MSSAWRTVTLGDVIAEERDKQRVESDIAYPLAGVLGFGRGVLLRDAVRGAEMSAQFLYRIRTGQLMYSRLKAFEGAFALVPHEADGRFVSNEFPTFDVDTSAALPEFLALYLARPRVWEELQAGSEGMGARRERLQPVDFLELELDLPPLDAQRDIVFAVETAERAAAVHERHSRHAFTALRAAREELLLTDDDWEELPEGWRRGRVADVADIRSGITKGRKTRGSLTEAPFIRAANVQNGYLDLTEVKTLAISDEERDRFALLPGDILMTEGGNAEHVGRGWIWEGQAPGAVCQNHVFRVRIARDDVLPRFLGYVIGASPARAYCYESAKKTTNLSSINKTQVSDLVVPIPPVAVQASIVRWLDGLRTVGVAEQRAAVRLTGLRAALAEELLTGTRDAPAMAAVA